MASSEKDRRGSVHAKVVRDSCKGRGRPGSSGVSALPFVDLSDGGSLEMLASLRGALI